MDSCGAQKQDDPLSAADVRAFEIHDTTNFIVVKTDVGMLWVEENIQFPNNNFSSLVLLSPLKKCLWGEH